MSLILCASARGVSAFFALSMAAHVAAAQKLTDWATVKNERHGFAIGYPSSVFEQKSPPKSDEGRVLTSKDGKAKLLVGAFSNEENQSLKEYRAFLMTDEFAGAAIAYAPVRRKWFVLSGVRNGEMFYQRVSFTCGGKLINSWAMLYPESDRKTYDRVVEAVARTYMPGSGRTGACD